MRLKKMFFTGMLLLLVVSGCSQKEAPKHMKFDHVKDELEEKFMDTIMVEMNDSDFFALFDLDPSQVVQHHYTFAFLDTKADEVVMIQLRDEETVDQVEKILWDRVNALRNEFDGYIDAQKAIVDQAIVFREGKYVFLIVSAKAREIQDYLIGSFA